MPAAVVKRLYLNDIDMSLYGMLARLPLGWGDAPAVDDAVSPLPGSAGGLLLTHEGSIGPREVAVEGILHSPEGNLRARWDEVKRILASPVLEIRFEDWPDRMGLGRYQGGELRPLSGLTPDYGAGFTLRFRLPNPYLLARSVDIYAASAGQRVELVLGTAPSHVDLALIGLGVSSAPSVQYRDARGEVRGVIAFDVTMALAEWIEVDGQTWTMTRHRTTGQAENAASLLVGATGGSARLATSLFVADPQDGDEQGGPTLNPIGCNLVAQVRRAYL